MSRIKRKKVKEAPKKVPKVELLEPKVELPEPDDNDVRGYLNSPEYRKGISVMVKEVIPPPIRTTRERYEERDIPGSKDIIGVVRFSLEENPAREGETQLAGRLFNVEIGGKYYEKVTLVVDRHSRLIPEEGKRYYCKITRMLKENDLMAVFLVEPLREEA